MDDIFSTPQRVKILKEVVFKTSLFSVTGTATNSKLSKALVSQYFKLLVKKHVLKRKKNAFIVNDSPLTKAIKILLNIQSINIKIFEKFSFVIAAGLYGSCARGENTELSDVDLWIKVKPVDHEQLAALRSSLNKKIEDLNILFLTDEKLKQIKGEGTSFYYALVFGSIILLGKQDDIF